MSDKSYVTMAQRRCEICGTDYDTGEILLDKRLRNKFEHHTLVGMGMCPEHQKLYDDGYIALVEAIADNSGKTHLKPEEANRTGKLCHLRREAAASIFNIPINSKIPLVFVQPGVIERLQEMTKGVD